MDFDQWWAQKISPQTPANSFQPYALAKAAWDAGVASAEQNRAVPSVEAPPPQAQPPAPVQAQAEKVEKKVPPHAPEKAKSGKALRR